VAPPSALPRTHCNWWGADVKLLLYRNEEFERNERFLQICVKTTIPHTINGLLYQLLKLFGVKIIHITDKKEGLWILLDLLKDSISPSDQRKYGELYFKIWKETVVVSFSYCNGIDIQRLIKAAETPIKVIGNSAHIRTGYLRNRNRRNPQSPDRLWAPPPRPLCSMYRGLFPGDKEAGPWSWPITTI
jgi:hypothetical protein